jgi:hypothetical protein
MGPRRIPIDPGRMRTLVSSGCAVRHLPSVRITMATTVAEARKLRAATNGSKSILAGAVMLRTGEKGAA